LEEEMTKTMGWKLGLIALIIGFSVVMLYPPEEKINLGLDLKRRNAPGI